MNRIKSALLTAGLSLATALTLSCSSGDDGDGTVSSGSNGSNTRSSSSGAGSCVAVGSPQGDGLGEPVTYKGQTYKTVVIGTQTWFAENLNVEGGKCYGEGDRVLDLTAGSLILSDDVIQEHCSMYGRLYDWATAMDIDAKYNDALWGESNANHQGICPDGWHIPSDCDWDILFRYVDEQNGGRGYEESKYYDSRTAGKYLKTLRGWEGMRPSNENLDAYGFSALPGGQIGDFGEVGKMGLWWSASDNSGYGGIALSQNMSYTRHGASWNNSLKGDFYSVRCVKD